MAFPGRFLDELTARTDMIPLVTQYTPMTRRGTRWFGCCPFHSEKTPSFTVTPDTGLFYCFGCHAGGGPIQFVMRAENLEFADAVRHLASRLGIPVPEDDAPGVRIRRERLLEINKMAARWFYETLGSSEGRVCAEYMHGRGIRPDAARRFGLGYAPAHWDGLLSAMRDRGVSTDEMTVAGLASRARNGGIIDAFYNRLMFPIFDLQGQVIAFSGRALDSTQTAKYKNSAESPLYQKSRVLYAAHLARKSEKTYWILCEGNVDVFMLHQTGFDNAVATCGTALTDAQARLIGRHVNELVIAFDADAAGQNATRKAIGLLEAAGVKARVMQLHGAKDPDEFIQKYGSGAFEKLLAESQNHTEYRLALLEAKHTLTGDMEKLDFLREATELLASLPTESERSLYAVRVAKRLGISDKAVLKDVEAVFKKKLRASDKAFEKKILLPSYRDTAPSARQTEELTLYTLLKFQDLETTLTQDDFSSEDTKALFLNRNTPPHSMPEDTARLYAKLTAQYGDTPVSAAALADLEERLKNPAAKYKYYRDRTYSKEEGEGL